MCRGAHRGGKLRLHRVPLRGWELRLIEQLQEEPLGVVGGEVRREASPEADVRLEVGRIALQAILERLGRRQLVAQRRVHVDRDGEIVSVDPRDCGVDTGEHRGARAIRSGFIEEQQRVNRQADVAKTEVANEHQVPIAVEARQMLRVTSHRGRPEPAVQVET